MPDTSTMRENKNMPDIRLDRTFWPVGHGAFYTERFYNHEDKRVFTAVYDCGGKISPHINHFCHSVKEIDYLFVSHFHRDHINGLSYLLKHTAIKHIVLPQIEETELVESYIYNAMTETEDNVEENSVAQSFIKEQLSNKEFGREAQVIEVLPYSEGGNESEQPNGRYGQVVSGYHFEIPDSTSGKPFWVYIPVNIYHDSKQYQTLIAELNNICNTINVGHVIDKNGKINWSSIDAILSNRAKEVKGKYKNIFKEHNHYSMPVFSGPVIGAPRHWFIEDTDVFDETWYHDIHWRRFHRYISHNKRLLSCLYMGDFEAKKPNNMATLIAELKDYYYRAGLQQVPHHYSRHNHNEDLYENRILAFGNVDDHKDVSYCHSIFREIRDSMFLPPLVITEDDVRKEIIYEIYC